MSNSNATLPTDPRRVRAFASFFKNYMSISSVIVAALPIPVTAFGALPTFADQKAILSTYTSLFCFLVLGFIFYVRHGLAHWMFPTPTAVKIGPDLSDEEQSQLRIEARFRERVLARRAIVIGAVPL